MAIRPSAHALLRLALGSLLVAVAAGVWEILASQPPGSAYHAGVLVGPIAQLRHTALVHGLLLLAGTWLLPHAARRQRNEPWMLVAAVHVGVVLTLGAMVYGAATGMKGVQIHDPRSGAQAMFLARMAGHAVLAACLLDLTRRLWRKPQADER